MAFPHVYNNYFQVLNPPLVHKMFQKRNIYIYIYIYFGHTDRAIGVFRKLEPVALVRQ